MKVLLIEDNEATIRGLIDAVNDRGWECKVCGFVSAPENIFEFDPDIIVMDWMYDAEDEECGRPIIEKVLAKEFRPTIVFSAHDLSETLEEYKKTYPLINYTQKGDDDSALADTIDKWKESASAISRLRHNMNTALVESSKALVNFQKMETFPEESVVSYMMSQRARQCFEEIEIGELPPPWIQYIYPPVAKSLLVADIIRFRSTNEIAPIGQPEEYAIILTPSCDMANNAPGETLVLVAKCCGKDKVTGIRLGEKSIDSKSGMKLVESLVKELNYGYNKSFVSMPALPNVLPIMTVDLKKLEFVQLEKIALSEHAFSLEKHTSYRVATITSPFREQVVWAHMINSCRPGVPARDMVCQAKGILAE